MNILVFTKRVAATQEEELRITGEGQAVDLSKVPFKVNDWDNYSVEEAVRIVDKAGGSVTAISIGDAESDEVLRRAIAMGAKDGFLVETGEVLHDPFRRSELLRGFIAKEKVMVASPCVLSIQSGINEPRYVSIMGIRKASKVERKVFKADGYETGSPRIELTKWVYPEKKGGATMLDGELADVCGQLLGILMEKGVCQ